MPRFIVDTSPEATAKVAAAIAQRLVDAQKTQVPRIDIKQVVAQLDAEIGDSKWRETKTDPNEPTEQGTSRP